jgi:hypothetical protein
MSNYTKKPALISMLLAFHDQATTLDAIRAHGELPASGCIEVQRIDQHRELSSSIITILGRAVATQRGSHAARAADGTIDRGQRRLAHRYTGSETWLLTGAGTVGLRALAREDVLQELKSIASHQRRLHADNAASVRAMTTLRLILMWHATTTQISTFSRDGLTIIAVPVTGSATPKRIYTNGEWTL